MQINMWYSSGKCVGAPCGLRLDDLVFYFSVVTEISQIRHEYRFVRHLGLTSIKFVASDLAFILGFIWMN